MNFKLPVTIFKEGKMFIAYSPALDLSTSAKTFEEVKKRFIEAVNIFFEELHEMGTTDEVLKELGWKKHKKKWLPLTPVAHEIQEMEVKI